MKDKLLLTTVEAAERLGISRAALYNLIRTHRIASVKIGRRRFIPESALHDVVVRLVEEAEMAA